MSTSVVNTLDFLAVLFLTSLTVALMWRAATRIKSAWREHTFLSRTRVAVERRMKSSVTASERRVPYLKHEGNRAFAGAIVEQQRRLLPKAQETLRLAQWLERQARDLAPRAHTDQARSKLERVQARIGELDAEAEHVAQLLANAEAALLASVGETNNTYVASAFADLTEMLEDRYLFMVGLNQSAGSETTGIVAWINAQSESAPNA